MKLIKLFEEFQSKSTIDTICKKYNIYNYTINQDRSIDVDGDVLLSGRELTKLPLKFGKVSGYFTCTDNRLNTLEGCPRIVGGDFNIYYNRLTSLIGAPESVGGDISCENTGLWTLEGCPTKIGGYIYCIGNPVFEIWKLIDDKEYLEIFLDYDMIDGNNLYLARLNDILKMMGRKPVTSVKGYNCI
jgi:hypothetical protein